MEPLRLIVFALFAAVVHGSDWSYEGEHGPEHWEHLGYADCGGQHQSPIDFTPGVLQQDTTMGQFSITNLDNTTGISWRMSIGHTVTITYNYESPGNAINVSGGGLPGTYKAVQFHFHWGNDSSKGSEHAVNGKRYPMELHIVTLNTKYPNTSEAFNYVDGVAVLGFFFEIDAGDNSKMATLVSKFHNITEADFSVDVMPFALKDIVANMTDFYRYNGSLTTPKCNEVVTWTVFTAPIKISEAQMAQFRKLQMNGTTDKIVDNFRPLQLPNGRMVKTTFSPPVQTPTTEPAKTIQATTTQASPAPCTVLLSISSTVCSLLLSVFGRL